MEPQHLIDEDNEVKASREKIKRLGEKLKPQSNQDVRENGKTILQVLRQIVTKYVPNKGCENCWGDLGGRCTDECWANWRLSRELEQVVVDLIETAKAEARKEFAEEVKKLGIAYDYEKISQLLATINGGSHE